MFFEGYKTGWKLFFKGISRIRVGDKKKKFILVIHILFASSLLSLMIIAIYSLWDIWVILGSFIILIIIFPPFIGFLYSPLFRKYLMNSFLLITACIVSYLIIDILLLSIIYLFSDIAIEHFFTD